MDVLMSILLLALTGASMIDHDTLLVLSCVVSAYLTLRIRALKKELAR